MIPISPKIEKLLNSFQYFLEIKHNIFPIKKSTKNFTSIITFFELIQKKVAYTTQTIFSQYFE